MIKNRVDVSAYILWVMVFFSCPLCICDLFLPLTGVAEQFALAEAAMNAWSSQDVENKLTGCTIPVQGINSTVIISHKEPF